MGGEKEEFKKFLGEKRKRDEKLYKHSVRELYDTLEGKDRQLFSGYAGQGILSEIEIIFKYYKIAMPAVSPNTPDGQQLQSVLDKTGVMSRHITLTGEWWKNDSMPLFCTDQDGGYHAVVPGMFGGMYYYDAKAGKKQKIKKGNEKNFRREAICFYRPFPKEPMSVPGLLKYMFGMLGIQDYAYLTAVSLIMMLLGLILPEVNGYIFNYVIPSGRLQDVPYVILLLLGVVISSALFRLFRTFWISRMGNKVQNGLQAGLWERILSLPSPFFKEYDSGELISQVMMMEEVSNVLTDSVLPIAMTTFFSLGYLIQVGSMDAGLVLPTILILLVMFGFSIFSSWCMVRLNKKQNAVSAALSGMVYQLFLAVGTIKVHGAEIRAFSRWAKLYQEKMKLVPAFIVKYADAINSAISIAGTLLIYQVIFSNELSASTYIAFQVAFGFLANTMGELSGIITQLAFVSPILKMMEPILKQRPETSEGTEQIEQLEGRIDLEHICFRYQPDMEDVLHDLTMSIEPGEYVALTGTSGCGKSTLFRLLLGFEKPNKGAVYFDGKDMADLDKRSLRKRIGTVLQDGMLFAGDIFTNIALCAPEITMDEAWEAARLAGCAEDIENMPMGMFTMVGDGNGGISGGQKQRILIARALAMQPDVFLFDEATSALDNITQKRVVETLAQRKATRIVIAHRLSTIVDCDRIIYMDKGSVAEQGTYEELMAKKGKFYELAKWQLVEDEE